MSINWEHVPGKGALNRSGKGAFPIRSVIYNGAEAAENPKNDPKRQLVYGC
jgi:hypothetical protein